MVQLGEQFGGWPCRGRSTQAQRIVDLIGFPARDRSLDPGQTVEVTLRFLQRVQREGRARLRPRGRGRRLRCVKQSEPGQGQGGGRMYGQGGVESRGSFVGHVARGPLSALARRLHLAQHGQDLLHAAGLQYAHRALEKQPGGEPEGGIGLK